MYAFGQTATAPAENWFTMGFNFLHGLTGKKQNNDIQKTSKEHGKKSASGLLQDIDLKHLGKLIDTDFALDTVQNTEFSDLIPESQENALEGYEVFSKRALLEEHFVNKLYRDIIEDRDFSGQNMKHKLFYYTSFDNCCFDNTNMTHTKFIGCDLRRVNLSKVVGLSEKNIIGCFWDENTIFPPGFDFKILRLHFIGSNSKFEAYLKKHDKTPKF